MAAFPHLLTDGTVLPKDGFKTKKWNEVPLIMTTGTDEFSLYTRINPYFAPSVKDKTVFTDEKKYAEFTFSKKYGSEMYRLFNAEASAEQMLDRYKAPIYTMTIAYGNNPELVGPETAFLSGSVHGIWIPFVTGYATSTTASYPKGSFDNPGASISQEKSSSTSETSCGTATRMARDSRPGTSGLAPRPAHPTSSSMPMEKSKHPDDRHPVFL